MTEICHRCKKAIEPTPTMLGYGFFMIQGAKVKVCYPCCAEIDKECMINGGAFTGYLTGREPPAVTNWPGTLRFNVISLKRFKINGIEQQRVTVRFNGPDGYVWSGVHRGIHNDIVRCKRTKEKAKIHDQAQVVEGR